LGADKKRLEWGIATARKAATDAGKDPDTLQYGAYVNVVCHDDIDIARELGRAGTSIFARFSVMHGTVAGPANEMQQQVFDNVHDRYDMNKHAQKGGNQTTALTDEFMDSYAIIGSADHCVQRLSELAELGIDKFSVAGPNFLSTGRDAEHVTKQFEQEVMEELHK
jgi:5,10-methylenetetrahydromethanopterin reductase